MTIKATLPIWKEVYTAIMTGVCGHAPEPLSKDARRVYKAMRRAEFNGQLVEAADSHPKELVWIKTGSTLEKSITEATQQKESMRRKINIEIWKAKDGWRWHAIRSGKIVAESGEAYSKESGVKRAVSALLDCIIESKYIITKKI